MSRRPAPPLVNLETDPRPYVGLSVVARYFGTDTRTISAWLDEGKLPYYQFGARRKIKRTDLLAFEQQACSDGLTK